MTSEELSDRAGTVVVLADRDGITAVLTTPEVTVTSARRPATRDGAVTDEGVDAATEDVARAFEGGEFPLGGVDFVVEQAKSLSCAAAAWLIHASSPIAC